MPRGPASDLGGRDGQADEELDNGLDDDGDGLIDEDLAEDSAPVPNRAPVMPAQLSFDSADDPIELVLPGSDPDGDALSYSALSYSVLSRWTMDPPDVRPEIVWQGRPEMLMLA